MNLSLIFGLAAMFIFAIGILIGQGLNGSTQIARDKRQATVQRDINDRRQALMTARQWAQELGQGHQYTIYTRETPPPFQPPDRLM